MDDNLLISRLQTLGMDRADAVRLVTTARNRNTRVSWVFISSLAGLYAGMITLASLYIIFMFNLDKKGAIALSVSFIPALLVISFFLPIFRTFLWSWKVLFFLKGR